MRSETMFGTLGLLAVLLVIAGAAEGPVGAVAPPSVAEARERARLLHDTLHATLQVVHHEYYRADESLKLPAAALKSVFRELQAQHGVQFHWLAVEGQAMNVEHKAQDDFERRAVVELTAGETSVEEITESAYRRAGVITLSSECLKCHAPQRTTNKARAAGLVISIPLKR